MPRPLNVEFDKLKAKLHSMSTRVEESYLRAMRAVNELDAALAETVVEKEPEIDSLELEVEEHCTQLLARFQPMSKDLRFVIAVLKINNDLERIGDLAKNIAKRAIELSRSEYTPVEFSIRESAEHVRDMLRMSINALIEKNTETAYDVLRTDDLVDRAHKNNFTLAENILLENPKLVPQIIRLISVSRSLERIGDLATNIAEEVIFVNEGRVVRHRNEEIVDLEIGRWDA